MTISCASCGIEWPKVGPRTKYCELCKRNEKRRQDRKYYSAHSGKIKARITAWTVKNRDYIRQRDKAKREANAEQIKRQSADRYANDPAYAERRKKRAADWYAKNRDRVRLRNTSPEGRKAAVRRENNKRASPHYRLHANTSRAVRASLKGRKSGRRWEDLVGYTLDGLVRHLERQFLPGMSWDNMGKWHVDHIIPRKAFTFSAPEDAEFCACWALTNLQPLWAVDNIRKHGKRRSLL